MPVALGGEGGVPIGGPPTGAGAADGDGDGDGAGDGGADGEGDGPVGIGDGGGAAGAGPAGAGVGGAAGAGGFCKAAPGPIGRLCGNFLSAITPASLCPTIGGASCLDCRGPLCAAKNSSPIASN